jgi:hypothetical protein
MSYPIMIGNDDAAEKFGGLLGLPTTILISQDGRQLRRIDGLLSYDESDIATLHYGARNLVLGGAIGAAYCAALQSTGRAYADNLMAGGALGVPLWG